MNDRLDEWTEQDEAYMKKYVQSHPDNRMAWYLLGKQYEKDGQLRKASYCYNQAGDIYKAFENEPLPIERFQEEQMLMMQAVQKRMRKRNRIKQGMRVLASLLLILLFGAMLAGEDAMAPTSKPSDKQSEGKDAESEKETKLPAPGLGTVVYVEKTSSAQSDRQLRQAVVKATKQNTSSTLVTLQKHGRWSIWTTQPQVWAIVKSKAQSESRSSQTYFPGVAECDCEPERLQAAKEAAVWASAAEQRLMAMSTHAAVLEQGKLPPASVGELAKGYPRNVVSGIHPEWSGIYKDVHKKLTPVKNVPKTKRILDKQWVTGEAEPFKEPLRIIIDKKTHRLAVVSGSIILRNYKVGLGGERTPEGSFVISEKVVNPNGTSTGAYGSRGMALSNTQYAIHGTNDLDSIGQDESLGCIRLSNADVEELFDMVAMGTKVTITSGHLPDVTVVPADDERYRVPLTPGQENPNKIYKWLD
ncbi:L,D-transpeptidase family protein [Paenibacillus sp. SC116]|uniref:L,D-transpeptidase n=1 Tax=Paenibacillus sp. SC116 TaxID=2968986 RepID=UPI00215A8E08|nr:L,D-transpeptidase family protein [Paenibacillus sp. SC116]MCR8843380.1 L,D-transpeptidase family protein [Paenibacillus sp. SC116]